MDLNDTPEQAAYRAEARAWLEANKDAGAAALGLLRGQRLHRRAPRVAAPAGRGRAGRGDLAARGRRPWPGADRAGHRQPGDLARAGSRDPRRDRDRDARAVPDRARLRGAEEPLSRARCCTATRSGARCSPSPAAGSDLAAVQTRARQSDDGSWTLNGQKVWTTNAQFASYGLLLARTDADVPKHKGLTMFIVPMDAPGVTVRGLRQISGEAEFNEVFFDDVRARRGRRGRRRRQRLGNGADGAHVRAADDRLRLGVVRLSDAAGRDAGRRDPHAHGRPTRAGGWAR